MATPLKLKQFVGNLTQIYDGASAGRGSRWMADVLDDKILFATESAPALYWNGVGVARRIPGLPDDNGWDGVAVIGGRVVLWRGQTVKSSATRDFSSWIPVALTATSGRAEVAQEFSQPDAGSQTAWVYLNDVSGAFTEEQFIRIVSDEDDPTKIRYSYYTVKEVSTSEETRTPALGKSYSVESLETETIFTNDQIAWPEDSKLTVDGTATELIITDASRDIGTDLDAGIAIAATPTITVPAVGEEVSLPLEQFPFMLKEGDYIYITDTAEEVGADIYEVKTIGQSLRVRRTGIGSVKPSVGDAISGRIWWQPWVEVKNLTETDVDILVGDVINSTDAIRLENENLSGAFERFDSIPVGSVVETVDANDSAEFENTGSDINGDIFQIIPLGEYGYILKDDSIQSMQPVDAQAGTWIVRGEVFGEGPIGRYAAVRVNDQTIIFWGKADIYSYSGGNAPVPIVSHGTTLAREELDFARADEIVTYHATSKQEVHFYYPNTTGEVRSLIINYSDGTAVHETLQDSFEAVTAAGEVPWEFAPRWVDLDLDFSGNSPVWNSGNLYGNKRWYEWVDEPKKFFTLLGVDGDTPNTAAGETGDTSHRLLASGRVYYRQSGNDCESNGYTALLESADFDFGDSAAWKYVDTVYMGLHVRNSSLRDLHPLKLYVQLGARQGLDDDIEWSDPVGVELTGDLAYPSAVHARASGRFIRVRFYSDQPGAEWRLSEYTVSARLGGSY